MFGHIRLVALDQLYSPVKFRNSILSWKVLSRWFTNLNNDNSLIIFFQGDISKSFLVKQVQWIIGVSKKEKRWIIIHHGFCKYSHKVRDSDRFIRFFARKAPDHENSITDHREDIRVVGWSFFVALFYVTYVQNTRQSQSEVRPERMHEHGATDVHRLKERE